MAVLQEELGYYLSQAELLWISGTDVSDAALMALGPSTTFLYICHL